MICGPRNESSLVSLHVSYTNNGSKTVGVLGHALDNEIRMRSAGKKTLDDAMMAIYERYGITSEHYELDDLIKLMSKSTNLDLDPFFSRYLKSRNALPLKEIMNSFGWTSYSNNYANEYYLIKNNSAPGRSKDRWEYLLHNRFLSN